MPQHGEKGTQMKKVVKMIIRRYTTQSQPNGSIICRPENIVLLPPNNNILN